MVRRKKEEVAQEPESLLENRLGTLIDQISEMNTTLNLIKDVVAMPIRLNPPVVEAVNTIQNDGTSPQLPKLNLDNNSVVPKQPTFPIPTEFRTLVNDILNPQFDIDIEYKETASFAFSILVPRKYSTESESYWKTTGEDRRTKVIQNTFGVNGVRQWCERVYDSFPPETKSQIVFDRGAIPINR